MREREREREKGGRERDSENKGGRETEKRILNNLRCNKEFSAVCPTMQHALLVCLK